jgi:hypothetical protein
MVCENRLSPTRTEYADIFTFPEMRVVTGVKDCVGNGNFGFCIDNGRELVVGDDQVCGYRMNTRRECRTRESNDGRSWTIETDCPRARVRAVLQVSRGRGRMVCMRNGRVEHSWRYSDCHY